MASETTYTCDRCGRTSLLSPPLVVKASDAVTSIEVLNYTGPDIPDNSLDLCPDCWVSFKAMFSAWKFGQPPPPPPPPDWRPPESRATAQPGDETEEQQ